jgi:hypothetical protein
MLGLIKQFRLKTEAVPRQLEEVVDLRLAQQRSCWGERFCCGDALLHESLGLSLHLNRADRAISMPASLEPAIGVIPVNQLIVSYIGKGIAAPASLAMSLSVELCVEE